MDIDGRRNGVRGLARVVAVVALVRLLELEDARATPLLYRDARIVVDHTLFVVPEHELGGLGGVPQGAHKPQEGAGAEVEVRGALDFRQGRCNKVLIYNTLWLKYIIYIG